MKRVMFFAKRSSGNRAEEVVMVGPCLPRFDTDLHQVDAVTMLDACRSAHPREKD